MSMVSSLSSASGVALAVEVSDNVLNHCVGSCFGRLSATEPSRGLQRQGARAVEFLPCPRSTVLVLTHRCGIRELLNGAFARRLVLTSVPRHGG